ncbi:PAS domain-containing sensor histidine kinase [Mangrovimonas spongiae]|uniref:histidine kinase n=1 Tax=Mangrovimonas spongiae TaxID=2494697 RepID=A0A3R9NYH5_9FLAO|nr:PAS domain-containing sensor histidine kinase [Mangrovimonas spongiae]RSK40426.1 PAS domain-containing sensor histidine kinase [Mangrovimonas spongiae]
MLQKDQDIFKILLESISEGVIIVDDRQHIVEVNDATEKMFGYSKEELLKQPLNILIPNQYHKDHKSHFDGFMKQQERRQMGQGRDIYGACKNGDIFPMEAGLNPFTIYGKKYVMALVIDISMRKEQEQKIKTLNENLEDKVLKRTQELNNMILELQAENEKRIKAEAKAKLALKKEKELNDLKTKFLSLVSHEFKTPLTGILTSTMLLSKYQLTDQQEKRNKHIKTISDKVHYLNNILNDFLTLEKLEKGKLKYTPTTFKLSKVVNEVVYNANMLLKEGQKINYPEAIDTFSLHQDEKILELALSNLVHNAIKYSSEHTEIDIAITQDKQKTVFKVKDNGIGIPEKDQKNIFNRYFRAENALLTQGTGIGLNIVKDHMKNLKGKIYFDSVEHKGTVFTIELPNNIQL